MGRADGRGTWALGAAWLVEEPAAASVLERTSLKPVANLVDTALVPVRLGVAPEVVEVTLGRA